VSNWATSTRRQRLPADWPARRARILTRDPVCRLCGVRPSSQADHIIPGDDHGDTNLQGVCGECHRIKSAREGGLASAARRPSRDRPPEPHPGVLP
jgi:5-methylcytosine-specific restriction endonuclease McrA